MVLVIVHHYVKPGLLQAARQRIAGNTERMVASPGFVARYCLAPPVENPLQLPTITVWETAAAAQRDLEAHQAQYLGRESESPYERAERQVFLIERARFPASS
jgi:hypothetical protein